MAHRIKNEGDSAGELLGEKIQYVLRGDSTLRGHVFSETKVFLESDSSILFLPAYPEIGRTTVDGTHFVEIDGVNLPANQTEFASDPVFSFTSRTLHEFVTEKSDLNAISFSLAEVREGSLSLSRRFATVAAGSVLIPDAQTDGDIEIIAESIRILRDIDKTLVVRSAAPLAAILAGVRSKGYLSPPLMQGSFSTLLVAGSHTEGATKQLAKISARWGASRPIDTSLALENSALAAVATIDDGINKLVNKSLAIVSTERIRLKEHNTLEHGEKVMQSIIAAVQGLSNYADIVVTKGGITSAEVARSGLGATEAWVLGQILPGISVWRVVDRNERLLLLVIVPGSVGDSDTLIKVLEIVGID